MCRQVDELLAAGIIEPSTSSWCNPVIMVKKATGEYRMCLDFRRLNAISKPCAYPLPLMTWILDQLSGAKFISKIDLKHAYHQVKLDPTSREYTAFSVPGRGMFQYVGMPFGLAGAPPHFQRLIDEMLKNRRGLKVFGYLDDLIIVTETFEEHLTALAEVFDALKSANLKINVKKCEFCTNEVQYLGYRVSEQGLLVDPERVKPMLEFSRPKNMKQVRRFLGMASWYRRFIPDFATIAEPLTRLTSKKARWTWTAEQDAAFDALKVALATAPVLTCPDYSKTFVLQTDASATGLGAVLTQEHEGGEKVVAYASRIMNKAERNYSATERECLAVLWACEHFRRYLEGYRFKVVTDHSSLRWLRDLKSKTPRLSRWAMRLAEYQFPIEYRKGSLNDVPDALSRMFEREENDYDDEGICAVDDAVELTDVPAAEAIDDWYTRRKGDNLANPNRWKGWRVEEGRLYRYKPNTMIAQVVEDLDAWKLVPPKAAHWGIIAENHDPPDAGHFGVEKTTNRVTTDYYWPGMDMDVRKFVAEGAVCQTSKVSQQPAAGLMCRRTVHTPWTVVAADCMEFPTSKNQFKYMVVFQDLFTKWIELCPIRKADGPTIIREFDKLIVHRFRCPEVLLTDNGTEFVNKLMAEVATAYGIHHSRTPPYHAQANPVERVNRVLKTMIISYVDLDHRLWDEHVHEFRHAYNTAVHSSSHVSPAMLNYGWQPRPPNYYRKLIEGDTEIPCPDTDAWVTRLTRLTQLHDLVADNLGRSFERQARYYNRHHRDTRFAVGDVVRVRQHVLSRGADRFSSKLARKYSLETYRVSKVVSPVVYELIDENGRPAGRQHVKALRLVKSSSSDDEVED